MRLVTFALLLLSLSGFAQPPQFRVAVDSLFDGIRRGQVAPTMVSGRHQALDMEILNYYKGRYTTGMLHELINAYPLDSNTWRTVIACRKADTLNQLYTFDLNCSKKQITVSLPIWYDTRNWQNKRIGTIHYFYNHGFDPKAAKSFDVVNRRIARKLSLPVDTFAFYLTDNYQQIMQELGLTYDRQSAGKTRDGFNAGQTIFAILHHEDFSHDLVHYYVWKIRKAKPNGIAEEGIAYYWGNAYYPDNSGQMIPLKRLKTDLRNYLIQHPGTDLLNLFQQNPKGLIGGASEVSVRSVLSGMLFEAIEKQHGLSGVLQLLNCGPGEANFFAVTARLADVSSGNFNNKMKDLLTLTN